MYETNHSETPETAKEKIMAHSSKSTDKKRKISRRHKKIGIPGIKEVYVARSNADTLLGDIADTVRGKASNLPSVKPPKADRPKKVVPRDHKAYSPAAGRSIGPSYGTRRSKGVSAFDRIAGGRPKSRQQSSVRAGSVRGGSPKGTK